MAKKSPGIYFSEIDNTQYSTMSTNSGATTVAVIGYATKGPIGVPVEITSMDRFNNIFGESIPDQYSYLAVSNIIGNGGVVIFTRVADMSTVSKSNVVIKNGQPAKDGKLVINSTENIKNGTDGYENSSVYTAVLKDGNNSKRLFVRSPANRQLTQANLLEQLEGSLDSYFGYDEFKVGNMKDETYSFSLTNIFGDEKVYGPYFVTASSHQDGEDLAEAIDKVINIDNNEGTYGVTNPYTKYYIVGTYGVNTSVEEGEFAPSIAGKEDIPVAYKATDAMVDKDRAGGVKLKFSYGFTLSGNYSTGKVDVTANAQGIITFGEFVEKLNKELETKTGNVLHAKFVEGKQKLVEGEAPSALSYSYILIYSTETEDFSFVADYNAGDDSVLCYKTPKVIAEVDTQNYIPEDFEKLSENNKLIPEDIDENTFKGLLIQQYAVQPDNTMNYHLSAKYNEETKSISIAPTSLKKKEGNIDVALDKEYKDSCIKVIPAEDGLKDDVFACSIEKYIFDEENGLGKEIARLNGENKISLTIKKDEDTKQITIFKKGSIVAPEISNIELDDSEFLDVESYKDLEDIIGKPTDDPDVEGIAIKVEEGMAEILDSSKDIVVFTAKEYGSSTNNIEVYVETVSNPFDETIKHNIEIYVNGNKKNVYEDVSYDMKADNYFVNLINESVENGGCPYLTAKVVKNEPGTEVTLQDSAVKSVYGTYVVGKPLNSSSVKRSAEVNEKAYLLYDYSVGEDGVAEGNDGDELFIEAMDPEGLLANQDLYSFHVLITPDNISQEVQGAAIKLCETLGDAIYIADPPQGLSKKGMVDWHNGKALRSVPLSSTFAVTYWPWLKVYDGSKQIWVMPSVVMAAQYVNTDKAGAWYPPAGTTYGNIPAIDLEYYPNKNDRDLLYTGYNRVNPFVKYNDGTILAYGEKTTQRIDSVLTKIHTRRMLIQMKKEIREALKGFIFKPTTSSNISTMATYVTTIMERYKTGGGLSSYSIDTSKNTTETLQQDIIYLGISCIPLGCIEEVNVTFTLNKSEETVTAA